MSAKNLPKTARIDASHMGSQSMHDDDELTPENEDWGIGVDANQENEDRASSREEVVKIETQNNEKIMSENTVVSPSVEIPPMSAAEYLAMLDRMSAFKEGAINGLKADRAAKVTEKDEVAKRYDAEIAEVDAQLAKLGATVAPAVAEVTKKRRGRRKKVTAEGTAATVAAPKATVGRRTRHKNDKTLKEAVVEVLSKTGRSSLKDIAESIVNSGFKTTSKKFSNTVRVQLYRLDDDGVIEQFTDNTFGLKAAK